MLTAQPEKGKPKKGRGPTVFYGITRDARALGVRYDYLWCVLTGRMKSRTLMERYTKLLRKQGRELPKIPTRQPSPVNDQVFPPSPVLNPPTKGITQ